MLKGLVETITKHLVDDPDAVEVTEVQGERAAVLELKVAKEDIGKIIGKRGAHAQALRTIISAASGKLNKRYTLEIIDQPNGAPERHVSEH